MLKTIASAAAVAVVTCLVTSQIRSLGFHLHYHRHLPGACAVVHRDTPGDNLGSEDFHVTSQGLAFITSGLYLPHMNASAAYNTFVQKHGMRGRILMFDFQDKEQGAVELKIRQSSSSSNSFSVDSLHPHGISVLEDPAKGEHLVYVVNHPHLQDEASLQPDAVEKFRFDPRAKELVHLKSITSDMLRITNDVAVVAEDEFYISNFIHSSGRLKRVYEQMLHRPWGSVLFYNGREFRTVASQLATPNGMTMSRDNSHLYVAMSMPQQIHVFKRQNNNSLLPVQQFPVYTIPDNLHLHQDGGSVLAGCHPIPHRALAATQDPEVKAPSQVLEFPLSDNLLLVRESSDVQEDGEDDGEAVSVGGELREPRELLYDHGNLISASSAAAVYQQQLLVGSLHDSLVVCQLPEH